MASRRRSVSAPSPDMPLYTTTASRIMTSVKRSLANSKRWSDPQPESSRFRQPDPSFSRPTVEQIAMGLHVSRTPHLRPFHDSRRVSSPPPPPQRSSLKKPSTSNSASSTAPPALSPASASSTTVASSTPSTPHSSKRSLMSRFLPGSRVPPAPPSPRDSTSDLQTPRKAVRFSSQVDSSQ